jgi:hypothetical protein
MTNDEDLPTYWDAWAILHNSHGPSLDTLVWMPAGDEPETDKDWVRVSTLDFVQTRPFTRRSSNA